MPVAANAQTCNVDLTSPRQTIRGFGGMNFPRWVPDLTASMRATAFGNGAGQLGFSILRIEVPPTTGFNWNRQLATAQYAVSQGAIVMASPWSPPPAMKTNNNVVGGELAPTSYTAFVQYLTDYYNFLSSNGVNLYAISVQNEPDISVGYDSCDYTPSQMIDFLTSVGASIPTRVIVSESFNFNRFQTNPILNDPTAEPLVDIIGGHIYGGGLFDYPLARQKGKEVWMTEHLELELDWNDTPTGALGTGKEIHDCMIANFNAYIWWYIRRFYGPIDDSGNVTKRGYVMSHFSKFVRPGYVRVDATETPTSGVSVSAYVNSTTDTLVLVAINQNAAPTSITFSLATRTVSNISKWETTDAPGSNLIMTGPISGGASFSDSLTSGSISTYSGTIDPISVTFSGFSIQ